LLRAGWAPLRARPTVVVGAGDCYVGLLAWLLARLAGARFVFDIYDKYDEFAGYRRLPFFDPFAFLRRRADLRLYCSRGLEALHSGEAGHTAFVPNGVEEQAFAPAVRDACRARLGLPADVELVGYFGSMEPDRGVSDLLEAMRQVRASGRAVTLLLCGRADPSLSLDEAGILFRGMVPHADMPAYLNACDLLVIPYRESAIMDMGASCKITEYLMCSRPLVSTRNANFTSNFPAQAGELDDQLVPARDPAALGRAIVRQLDERRVASRPLHLAWSGIAESTLQAFRALESTDG
jgi:glycosyltransferase involved in cell wall biosynthesis